MASVRITVVLTGVPDAEISDEIISEWIENRLNDGRNVFIQHASRGGGGGRVYGSHRASAPGEYPATDSGRLVNSVDAELLSAREGQLHSDVAYASYLTTGTSHMAPRQMLREALEEAISARPNPEELAKAVRFTTGPA